MSKLGKFAAACVATVVSFGAGGAALADALPATTTYVYDQTWIGPKVWFDLCPCESWGDIVSIKGLTGGGYIGAATSVVNFDFVEADGACTLPATQSSSVARFDYDNLIVQFQKGEDAGEGKYNVKCVIVKFKIENGRLWATATAAPYQGGSLVFPYDFGDTTSGTPLSGSGDGYGIQKVTVTVLDTATSFSVAGAPEAFGTVSPAYGRTFGHAVDEELGPLTAPDSWESDDGTKSAVCTGWKLYTQAEYGGAWALADENTGTEIGSLPFSGKATRLVWQWQPSISCTATAGAGGSVSPTSGSIAYGETFLVTATPDEGYFFASWSGVAEERRCENPIAVTVTEPVNLVATFLPVGSQAEWTGDGDDARASNPANWKGGACPVPGEPVVVTGDKAMTWDIAYPVGSWLQDESYTGVVTVDTVYPDARIEGTRCLSIVGDCTLTGGTWTHRANDRSRNYRLNVKVGGDMTIGPGAVIQADGCGYQYCIAVNDKLPDSTKVGGSYGGHGGFGGGDVNYTYGSYAAPEDPGNGGNWYNGSTPLWLPAGGAIRLEVGGRLVHDGTIRANSVKGNVSYGDYYSGSGGSVYVIAGSIEGSGTLKANSYGNAKCGGGGRVAVRLTGADSDFSQFDLVSNAQAVPGSASTSSGSHGTIYGETASDVPGEGWLVMRGNGVVATEKECGYGDPFTFETTSLHFAKITVTNNAIFRVHAGCTLDLRGTEVVADDVAGRTNGIRLNGGTLVFAEGAEAENVVNCYLDCQTAPTFPGGTLRVAPGGKLYLPSSVPSTCLDDLVLDGGALYARGIFSVPGDVTVRDGSTLSVDMPMSVGGSLTVKAGGVVTQRGPQNTPTYRCDITTAGDFTVEAGGRVSVSGCGYSAQYSPSGYLGDGVNSGVSHGGQGYTGMKQGADSTVAPYGSIVEPALPGAGSTTVAGGGVVKLTVGGTLTVDGSIDANGAAGQHYSGAGGSVNLTAARLAGAGTISADAANASSQFYGPSGGGRVAVTLTAADADFADFPVGNITAFGQDPNRFVGGAGTVWLRTAAQGADEGTLVVRNRGTSTPNVTTVGGTVGGTSFGDVLILDNAKLGLADGTTMTVRGAWSNAVSFAAGAGSTVAFAGDGVSTVSGDNAFAGLSCQTPGKVVEFAADSVQTVTEVLSVAGGATDETLVTLRGADGASWRLNCANAGCVLSGLALGGCTSDKPLMIVNGKDLGGNSDNVLFVTVTPGEEIVWTGAADDLWENAANWDIGRSPVSTDRVRVPAAARTPALGTDGRVARLSVEEGASLALGAHQLVVDESADFHGTVSGLPAAVLRLGGSATLAGAFDMAGATVVLDGATPIGVTLATASSLPTVQCLGEVSLTGDLTCAVFSAAAGASVAFAEGLTLTATRFLVAGTSDAPVALTGAGVWNLSTMDSDVAYAEVSDCDASGGMTVISETSSGSGTIVNWLFEDTRVKWVGGDTNFMTPGNWSGGAVPTEGDDVYIGGPASVVLAAADAVRVKTLSVGAGATLTVNGELATVGSVSLARDAKIEWNKRGSIGGDLVMLDGSTLTHAAGGTVRLDLEIAGNGLLQPQAKVDVKGCGYGYGKGFNPGGTNAAGSHGGRGYNGNMSALTAYGSIVAPITCAGTGGNATFSTHAGGGAASLVFGGALTMNGEIDADGADHNTYYGGAGGSIRIVARTLAGSGSLHANGNLTTAQGNSGGGGRVSVVLTAGDFADWTGTAVAFGGRTLAKTDGSAGTVFLQAAGEPGTLHVFNRDETGQRADSDITDFPSLRECDPDEVTGIDVVVGTYGTLYLTKDTTIRSLSVEGKSPRIKLNGHALTVTAPTRRRDRLAVEKVTTAGGTAETPGQILWTKPGLILLFR